MIKSVIFDLDGTLLNRDVSVQKFVERQYERLHKWVGHIPKEIYISRFIELDCRGYVWKDKVYKQLVDAFDIQGISWTNLLDDYVEQFKYSCIAFPNLIHMFDELKHEKLTLGIITNGFGTFQMDNIKALGIKKYVDTILISEWEGIKKPDPKIFLKAIEKLHVEPNQCVFVGDHPENDIHAAKNVGMKSIWKRDYQWDHANADYIIDDLLEVPNIIKKMKG